MNMCRLLALKDGTIINQSPISPVLCTSQSKRTTRLKISKDYRDGEGIVACCNWNGCNSDAVKATMSKVDFEATLALTGMIKPNSNQGNGSSVVDTSNQSTSTLSSTISALITTKDGHITSAQKATSFSTMTPEPIAIGNQIKVQPQGLDETKSQHILTQPQGSEVIKAFEKGSDFANGLYDPFRVYEKLQEVKAQKFKIKLTPAQIEAIKKGSETHIYVDQDDTILTSLNRPQVLQETPTAFISTQKSSPKLVESNHTQEPPHILAEKAPPKVNDTLETNSKLSEELADITTPLVSTPSSSRPNSSLSNFQIKNPLLNGDLLLLLEILRRNQGKSFSYTSSSPSSNVPSTNNDEEEDFVKPPLDLLDLLTNKPAKERRNHLTSSSTPSKVVVPSVQPGIAGSTLGGFAEFPPIESPFKEQNTNLHPADAVASQTRGDNLIPRPLTTAAPSHPFSEGEKRNVPFGMFSQLEEPPFEPDKEETRSKNTRPLTMAHLEKGSSPSPENGARDLKSCCSFSIARFCFLIGILVLGDLF
ncbi:uncharacterized protein LOC131877797 isoform X2 [Tigriopus californicus]|nr:uncharacterized protein LOC131877797 isoform X2 [Tigriopus californicus]